MSKRVEAQQGNIAINPITGVVELYNADVLVARTTTTGSGSFEVNIGGAVFEPVVSASSLPSGLPDAGTTNDAILRWDTSGAQWIEETQLRGTAAGAFQIRDASLADYGEFSHDGTDFVLGFVNTTDWNINSLSAININSGATLNIFDGTNTDSAAFAHNGTDFVTTFTNTVDWDLIGLTQIRTDSGLFVDGNIEIDGAGWGIFPNKLGVGTVPNVAEADGADLQVVGSAYVSGDIKVTGGVQFVNPGGTVDNVIFQAGSPDEFAKVRNFTNVATLWEVFAQSSSGGNFLTDQREATLALTRTEDGAGNSEFADLYNNGYHGNLEEWAVSYGYRMQKRGTGEYRPFLFDWYDGTTQTRGWKAFSPDDAGGPYFEWYQDMRIQDGATMYLEEVASAKADIPGFGQFWVQTDTLHFPMFTADDGNDYRLGIIAGSPPTDAVMTWAVVGGTSYGRLNAEANLTFSGSLLSIRSASQLRLYDGGNSDTLTIHEDGVRSSFVSNANPMQFRAQGQPEPQFSINFDQVRVENNATFQIEETANANSNQPGYGQLWVRNDTPNTLIFRNDAGNDFVLAGVNTGSKQGATLITFDDTPTEIIAIPVPSGERLGFRVNIIGTSLATGDTMFESIFGAIRNHSGTTAVVGSSITDRTDDAGASSWVVTVAADDATDELTVDVTGAAATEINWRVSVETLELGSLV